MVSKGGPAEYDDMLQRYRTSDMHEEKLRALRALGYNDNPQLIKRSLEFALTDEVRSQDIFILTAATAVTR